MALTLGTNCGFVTSAPAADPAASGLALSNGRSAVTKDTSPTGNYKITEIGWYCGTNNADTNFEVAIYAADGSGGIAGTRLALNSSNTVSVVGWQRATINYTLASNTVYWIAMQNDADGANYNSIDYATSGGSGFDYKTSATNLPDPYGGDTVYDTDGMAAIYALVEEITGPTPSINIGDTWKNVSAVKINIGDTWKTVSAIKINIGDTWKTVL